MKHPILYGALAGGTAMAVLPKLVSDSNAIALVLAGVVGSIPTILFGRGFVRGVGLGALGTFGALAAVDIVGNKIAEGSLSGTRNLKPGQNYVLNVYTNPDLPTAAVLAAVAASPEFVVRTDVAEPAKIARAGVRLDSTSSTVVDQWIVHVRASTDPKQALSLPVSVPSQQSVVPTIGTATFAVSEN